MRLARSIVLTLAALSPACALAADPQGSRPVALPSWEGFYAGSFFGAGAGRFTSSQTATLSASKTGMMSGALAGWNGKSGWLVYGVEADLGLNTIRAENAGTTGLIAHGAENLYSARLRGRLGADFGQFMPFVAAGLTYNESYVRRSDPNQFWGATQQNLGWNTGLGVDYATRLPFFGPMVLRGEYLYEGIPSANYTYDPAATPVRMKHATHVFRAAIISTSWFKDPRPSQASVDWRGPYVGIMAGYGQAKVRNGEGTSASNLNADGGIAGFYSGRNFQFGNIVAGFETSIGLANWTGTGLVPGTTRTLDYRSYVEGDLRARLGYAMGSYLPFIATGMAWGRSEQIDLGTSSQRGRVPTRAVSIGAGLDYRISEKVSTRIEYARHQRLGDETVVLSGGSFKQSRSVDAFRIGVAYHLQ